MARKYIIVIITMILIISTALWGEEKRWSLDLEVGPVFASSNTVQVPNPEGTRFSLTDAFDVDAKIYYRLRLNFRLGKRHQLSALFAPLTLTAAGTSNEQIRFGNNTFEAGQSLDGSYKFNSYRLTYRYLLVNKPKLQFWIGFTSKIRDAKIELSSDNAADKTTDFGFVPLLNLILDWRLSKKNGLLFEADALASPGGEGRAEDVSLSFYQNLSKNAYLRIGYRFVEGGANVAQVYNFAFIHYFYVSVQLRF